VAELPHARQTGDGTRTGWSERSWVLQQRFYIGIALSYTIKGRKKPPFWYGNRSEKQCQ